MTAWKDVLATALIGTDRRPTGAENPAAEVLDFAASWTPYRRAGVRPTTMDEDPPAAPPETAPLVGQAASVRLELLLEGGPMPWESATRELILAEWLGLAAHHGFRVTPHLLPALLDLGRLRRELRPRIVAVGGARAPWLAELNPDWRYLTRTPGSSTVDENADSTGWETGAQAQRLGYLRRLRRADPAAARELLQREWATLTPDERGDLVGTLADGLTLADETLLERALDDRRKEVREASAALLVRMPGSAYQARMVARARACVSIGDSGVLVITPPAECDKSMRRDGIVAKPPSGVGARAWWLEEVLALTPLSTWPGPAAEFVATPIPDDWASTVHRGLARGAAIHRDPSWAAATLDALGATTPRDRAAAAALYPILDGEQLARRAIAALTQGVNATWGPLLVACPAPWPDALGRAVMGGVSALTRRDDLVGDLYQLCRLAAVRLPAGFAQAALALAEQTRLVNPQQRSLATLESMAALLSYRHDMALEITAETTDQTDETREMP